MLYFFTWHPEILHTQLWNWPLTYFLPQVGLLCTHTNHPPSFKTTIKKKKGKPPFENRLDFNTRKGQTVPKCSCPRLFTSTPTSFRRAFHTLPVFRIPGLWWKPHCCFYQNTTLRGVYPGFRNRQRRCQGGRKSEKSGSGEKPLSGSVWAEMYVPQTHVLKS